MVLRIKLDRLFSFLIINKWKGYIYEKVISYNGICSYFIFHHLLTGEIIISVFRGHGLSHKFQPRIIRDSSVQLQYQYKV